MSQGANLRTMTRASRLRHSSLLLGLGIHLLPSFPAVFDIRQQLLFQLSQDVLLLLNTTVPEPVRASPVLSLRPSCHRDELTTDRSPKVLTHVNFLSFLQQPPAWCAPGLVAGLERPC